MIPPKLRKAMKDWLIARVPEVANRVRPFKAPPIDAAPYLTYHGVSHRPVNDLDARGVKKGLAGFNHTRVQVDVWDTDYARCGNVAAKITGDTVDNPGGLHGWQGWFPDHEADGRVAVQACFLVDAEDDDEEPDDGSAGTWYRVRLDFEFHYAEG